MILEGWMETPHGRQYLEQYCRFWAKRARTECGQDCGRIDFDTDNVIMLRAQEDILHVTIHWRGQDVRTMQRLFVQNFGRCLPEENELTFQWMAVSADSGSVGRLH